MSDSVPVPEGELAATVARMEARLDSTQVEAAERLMSHYRALARRFETDLAASPRDVLLAKASALMLVQEVAGAQDDPGQGPAVADAGPFIWHELVTGDQAASGAFFCELLGWTRRQVDAGAFGLYTLFQQDGRDIAGMMNPTPDTPATGPFWHAYIAVESVDECAGRAVALGGAVLVAPHDVADVGRICAVVDPVGAVAHLMQPVKS